MEQTIQRVPCGNVNAYLVARGEDAILVDTGQRKYRDRVLAACRPFRMPPTRRKAAHRKSYRIADVLLVIVTAFCVASVLWGYGCAYQVGYGAAEHFFTEVRHG